MDTPFQFDLVDEGEAARLLAVGQGTLRQWRSRRIGPPYLKVGGAVRYSRRDLVEYVEGRRHCDLEAQRA